MSPNCVSFLNLSFAAVRGFFRVARLCVANLRFAKLTMSQLFLLKFTRYGYCQRFWDLEIFPSIELLFGNKDQVYQIRRKSKSTWVNLCKEVNSANTVNVKCKKSVKKILIWVRFYNLISLISFSTFQSNIFSNQEYLNSKMNKSAALLIGMGIGICFCYFFERDWDNRNADMLQAFSYGGLATYIALRDWFFGINSGKIKNNCHIFINFII